MFFKWVEYVVNHKFVGLLLSFFWGGKKWEKPSYPSRPTFCWVHRETHSLINLIPGTRIFPRSFMSPFCMISLGSFGKTRMVRVFFTPRTTTNDKYIFFVFPCRQTPTPVCLSQVVYCFSCGKVGKLADLLVCNQCEGAYYCNRECERAHAKAHTPVCVATVTAKAQHAHRVRRARAVREKGQGNVEGGEEDNLCVICIEQPEIPTKVRLIYSYSR